MSSSAKCAIIAAVVLMSGVGAHAQWLPDYAANGSAEEDVNRDGMPDGWGANSYRSPAKTAWDKEVAHTGAASMRVADSKHPTEDAWDANAGRWLSRDRKAVTAGRQYTLRAFVKTQGVTGRATIAISWFKGGSWVAESHSEPVTGDTDWQELTVTASAPPAADTSAIYLCLSASKGTVWFDDVCMVEGEELPREYRPLEMRETANAGFRDEVAGDGRGGWTDQGDNDARNIPLGKQSWRGVPFEIIDPKTNDAKSCIVLRGTGREDFPETVSLKVGESCDVVYFLHNCAWASRAQGPVARYTVSYADGAQEEVDLRNGREMVDWWNPEDTKESAVGWRGSNAQSASVGLSIFPWRNPRPQSAIESIRFSKGGGDAVPILVAATIANGPPVLAEAPLPLEFTDTSEWYPFEFALDDPTLEEIDLSFLHDPPAGKHGFVTVGGDGHLQFEDGTPARFFGVDIGGANACPTKQVAATTAARLARVGINMVRLHAVDAGYARLIDYDRADSRHLNAEALDRYDYFVAELKKHGIYCYFDLLDYRKFMDADGVKEASKFERPWTNSIKGASCYDPRMIELQKEYATQLLTHRNPYTGNRYVDEPAMALLEITNENSVFYMSNTQLTLPAYFDDLRQRWNAWLLERHGGRAGLARAWTNAAGECALLAAEDPAKGTVLFPLRHLYADLSEAPHVGEKSPARLNAMTRFLYEVTVAYYTEMRTHLRSIGVRIPITGTNQDFSDASNFANYECDFMSRNNYWCHPNVRAKPFFTFRNESLLGSDVLSVANPIANIASSTAAGKPMVVPEFNFPWPNEYRAEALPLMACYARLQGWDGLIVHSYSPGEGTLSHFRFQSDPVRWGQTPLAALIFLRGDIASARTTVHVGHSTADIFAARPRRTSDEYCPYRYLPYISKVRNAYFEREYTGDAEAVISSGHSAAGSYAKAKRAIVFADSPFADEGASEHIRATSALATVPALGAAEVREPLQLVFKDFMWPERTATVEADTLLDIASLPEETKPFGTTADGKRGLGFIGRRFCIAPHVSALQELDPAWPHRLYLAAAAHWKLPGGGDPAEAGRAFRSDTGQLVLNREAGVFTANAPRLRGAVGFLGEAGPITLGSVTVTCRTLFAAITLISLDAQPIESSARLLLTAVARAENTGQAFDRNRSRTPETGRAPVIAEPVDCDVELRGQTELRAWSLTPRGEKKVEVPLQRDGAVFRLNTRGARSPWVLVEKAVGGG